jgi:hypothetical protein
LAREFILLRVGRFGGEIPLSESLPAETAEKKAGMLKRFQVTEAEYKAYVVERQSKRKLQNIKPQSSLSRSMSSQTSRRP